MKKYYLHIFKIRYGGVSAKLRSLYRYIHGGHFKVYSTAIFEIRTDTASVKIRNNNYAFSSCLNRRKKKQNRLFSLKGLKTHICIIKRSIIKLVRYIHSTLLSLFDLQVSKLVFYFSMIIL